MTPAKRRPAAPASQGPTRTAPDVPIIAPDGPGPETKDGAELLGPEGEPLAQEASPAGARRRSAPPMETKQAEPEVRATKQSPARPLSLYPLPVWPD